MTYARQFEDRVEKWFEKLGCTLIEDTGRRTQGSGDRIMEHPSGIRFMIDAKSTRVNKDVFEIKSEWFDKICNEADAEGCTPVIAFNFFDRAGIWIVIKEDYLASIAPYYDSYDYFHSVNRFGAIHSWRKPDPVKTVNFKVNFKHLTRWAKEGKKIIVLRSEKVNGDWFVMDLDLLDELIWLEPPVDTKNNPRYINEVIKF